MDYFLIAGSKDFKRSSTSTKASTPPDPGKTMNAISQHLPLYALWAGAYLFGSIPWGLVLARAFGNIDIRRQGSGNIGATNVARVAGAGLGLATLVADVLKGALPAGLAQWVDPAEAAWVAAALLAFLGHLFPVFTGFRGGKGVATALGGFLVLAPAAAAAGVAVFVALFAACRRVSAASLGAVLLLPAAAALLGHPPVVWGGAAGASVLIFWRHAENIRRLVAGTEPVFRFGRPPG
jgi:glycerol-3-phosphate acyltransferase PlsY